MYKGVPHSATGLDMASQLFKFMGKIRTGVKYCMDSAKLF